MAASLTTSQEQPATLPLDGTELVRIVQGGSSARTTRGELSGTASRVSLVGRGIDGTGTVDVTAAVQLAIDNVASLGGGVVDCSGGRWLIDSGDLIVKKGVTLWGPWLNLGEPDGQDYSNIQSAFIVNPLYTIRLSQEFSALRGLGIFRKGLTNPTTVAEAQAEIAAFAGTAITVGYGASKDASDTYVGFCLVIGFEYAYYCDFNERPRVEYLAGDCTNGIYMSRCYDMDHIHKCQFWPYVTAHHTWSQTSEVWRRQGKAYAFDVDVDWGQATDSFSYGYDTGFYINDSSNCVLMNCGADGSKNDNTYSVGYHINGLSQKANLIGCKSATKNKSVLVATTHANANSTQIIGGNLWAASNVTGRHIDVSTGNVIVLGVTFFDGPNAVTTGSGAGQVSINSCVFDNISNPYSFYDISSALVGTGNIFLKTTTDSTYGRLFSTNGLARSTETGFSDDSGGPSLLSRKSRGTRTAQTAAQSGDEMYGVTAAGWDGSGWVNAAKMRLQVQGAPSAGNVSGTFIWTTRNSGGTLADRLALHGDGTLYPIADNAYPLGGSGTRWSKSWVVDAHTFPLASVTPTINGELVVQATSNTSLTFKYRGSDGTVRSASLTLA